MSSAEWRDHRDAANQIVWYLIGAGAFLGLMVGGGPGLIVGAGLGFVVAYAWNPIAR